MASSDAVEAMHGFFQRRPKVTAMTQATSVFDGYVQPLPYLMCAFETQAYPVTNPSYSLFALMEASRTQYPDPYHIENNIAAVLFEPSTGTVVSKFSLARKVGAQDIDQLLYTPEQGFVAAYTDFGGARNDAGIVKVVDIKEEIRDYHYFANNPIDPLSVYGLSWTQNQTQSFRLYNNSIIDLVLDLSASSTTTQSPSPYTTWQLNNTPITISGDAINTTRASTPSMTYLPGGAMGTNNDNVEVRLYPHQFSLPFYHKAMPIFGPLSTGGTGVGAYKRSTKVFSNSDRELKLELSQNPALAFTTAIVRGSEDQLVSLRLYDLIGRELLSFTGLTMTGQPMEQRIAVSALSNGIYMLIAEQASGERVQVLLTVKH